MFSKGHAEYRHNARVLNQRTRDESQVSAAKISAQAPLLGEVRRQRAEAGLPPIEFDPADEQWLTAAQMRERYGVSDMWLWRRTAGAERQHGQAA